MRNANAWCVSYLGILMAGGCATLLNGWWQGGELAAGIEDSEAKLVIADVQRAARLAEPGVQHGAKVVTLDIAQPLDRAIAPLPAGGSPETGERTSVGEGQSESVRVDLGGRRIHQKKTNIKENITNILHNN